MNACMPFSKRLRNNSSAKESGGTLCIPKEKAARREAIVDIRRHYEDVRITLVHDCFLRNWEWVNLEIARFAIIISSWFSRGWASLELAKSRKAKVLFKGPHGPLIKDLDQDILAKDDDPCASLQHQIATEVIASLRKGEIAEVNPTFDCTRPTSYPLA
jgi:hypothetical protein